MSYFEPSTFSISFETAVAWKSPPTLRNAVTQKFSRCNLMSLINGGCDECHLITDLFDLVIDERFQVFTEVTMKNAIFCSVTPYGSCMNRRLSRNYRLHDRGKKSSI
jgi:hypothetical protein